MATKHNKGLVRTGDGAAGWAGVLRGTIRSHCVADQITESWTTWDRAGVPRSLQQYAPGG